MEQEDLGKIVESRTLLDATLLENGADYEEGDMRLELTLEQVTEVRSEMVKELEAKVQTAVEEKNWGLVEEIGGKLKKTSLKKESLPQEVESTESVKEKLPNIIDYTEIFPVVGDCFFAPEYITKDGKKGEEVKSALEEMKNILGEEVFSSYKLEKLTLSEFFHLSKFLKDFYKTDGSKQDNFQESLFSLIKVYMPPRFNEISIPFGTKREYTDDFYKKLEKKEEKNIVTRFRNDLEKSTLGPSEGVVKEILRLIVRSMDDHANHKNFLGNIINDSKSRDQILDAEPEKVLITEYALYTAPGEERDDKEFKNCLYNIEEVYNFAKNFEVLETEQSKELRKKVGEKASELKQSNNLANRSTLMGSVKEYMSSIKSYVS